MGFRKDKSLNIDNSIFIANLGGLKMKKLFLIGLVLLIVAFSVKAVYTPDEYTVALWHFDECNGNIANDVTGNGNTGNLNNVVWTENSIDGCAVRFNGLDSMISIVKTPSVDFTEQVTLETWIKRSSNADGTIISRNGPYYLAIRDNVVSGGVYADGWTEFSGNTQLQTDRWYHIAMTYNGARISLYVDGRLDNSIAKTGQMPQVSQAAYIGWGEPGQNQYFNGLVDEARISNIARISFDVNLTDVISPCTGDYLFCDDFNDNSAGGWNPNGGTWIAENGEYIQTTQSLRLFSHNNFLSPQNNYRIEADVQFYNQPGPGGSSVGLLTKYQNPDDFGISLSIHPYHFGGAVILYTGIESNFEQYPLFMTLNPFTWYHLRIDVVDGKISAYIDNELVVENIDVPSLPQNVPKHIAVATHNLAGIFDNVRVTSLMPTSTTTTTLRQYYTKEEIDEMFNERDSRINAIEEKNNEQDSRLINLENKDLEQDNKIEDTEEKNNEQDDRLNVLEKSVSNIIGILNNILDLISQRLVLLGGNSGTKVICYDENGNSLTINDLLSKNCDINDKGECACS